MRPALAAVLVLLLVALPARGQESPLPFVEVGVEPLDAPVRPLQGAAVAVATVRASCGLAEASEQVPVRYVVEGAPSWMKVVASPAADAAAARSCDRGYVAFETTLAVTVDADAPALVPTPVRLVAIAGEAPREARGEATLNVTADYFGILDVSLPEAIQTIPPGSVATFKLVVTNHGNGRTRVAFEIVGVGEGITVAPVEPILLGSRQLGDPADAVTKEVLVFATAPPARGFVNRVDTFSVHATSHLADDAARKGDESTASFLVTTRSTGAVERAMDVPGVGAWAVVAVLAACAWRRVPFA